MSREQIDKILKQMTLGNEENMSYSTDPEFGHGLWHFMLVYPMKIIVSAQTIAANSSQR
jgi:hypothetical protein